MTRLRPISLRRFGLGLLLASLLSLLADPAAASNAAVGLAGASQDNLAVPRWLYLATGGATVGASALLASFVTDRRFIERVHLWQTGPDAGVSDGLLRALRVAGGVLGLAVLALAVSLGYTGPQVPTVNFAVIVVFAGLRAGYTMLSYLVADTWRALNPWRTLVSAVPNGFVSYPERLDRARRLLGRHARRRGRRRRGRVVRQGRPRLRLPPVLRPGRAGSPRRRRPLVPPAGDATRHRRRPDRPR